MPDQMVQAKLYHESGIPEDTAMNVWSFTTAASKSEAAADAISEALQTFYGNIQEWMSPNLTGLYDLVFYERQDAPPRIPWREDLALNFSPPDAGALPEEVALCLSFYSTPTSGVPAGRRRGRIYAGPLATPALGLSEAGNGNRPKLALREGLANAGGNLLDQSQSAAAWSWAIWSGVDEVSREVVGGWVDNAFDTQRRRGVDLTARTTFVPA